MISNPSTGANVAYCTTDSTGALTFKITDSATESVGLTAEVSGGMPLVTVTTFA